MLSTEEFKSSTFELEVLCFYRFSLIQDDGSSKSFYQTSMFHTERSFTCLLNFLDTWSIFKMNQNHLNSIEKASRACFSIRADTFIVWKCKYAVLKNNAPYWYGCFCFRLDIHELEDFRNQTLFHLNVMKTDIIHVLF